MIYSLSIDGSSGLLNSADPFTATGALLSTNFGFGGRIAKLYVVPVQGVDFATDNGRNIVDVGLYTGRIAPPPQLPGEIQWASNSAVHEIARSITGVSPLSNVAMDETFQRYDAATRTLTIQIDARVSATSDFDRLIPHNSAPTPVNIIYGELELRFSADFGSVSGEAVFYSVGNALLGQLARFWQADFSGRLTSSDRPFHLPGGSDGTPGDDRLSGTGRDDHLSGRAGDDTLLGLGGDDRLDGGRGHDVLAGHRGTDILLGGAGNDRMFGGAGNDRLVGGWAKDVMFGGAGADRFVFADHRETGATASHADLIGDFDRAEGDRISLIAIDARPATAHDDAFRWIGEDPFGGLRGELRWHDRRDALLADLDGDRRADLWIVVETGVDLAARDLIL